MAIGKSNLWHGSSSLARFIVWLCLLLLILPPANAGNTSIVNRRDYSSPAAFLEQNFLAILDHCESRTDNGGAMYKVPCYKSPIRYPWCDDHVMTKEEEIRYCQPPRAFPRDASLRMMWSNFPERKLEYCMDHAIEGSPINYKVACYGGVSGLALCADSYYISGHEPQACPRHIDYGDWEANPHRFLLPPPPPPPPAPSTHSPPAVTSRPALPYLPGHSNLPHHIPPPPSRKPHLPPKASPSATNTVNPVSPSAQPTPQNILSPRIEALDPPSRLAVFMITMMFSKTSAPPSNIKDLLVRDDNRAWFPTFEAIELTQIYASKLWSEDANKTLNWPWKTWDLETHTGEMYSATTEIPSYILMPWVLTLQKEIEQVGTMLWSRGPVVASKPEYVASKTLEAEAFDNVFKTSWNGVKTTPNEASAAVDAVYKARDYARTIPEWASDSATSKIRCPECFESHEGLLQWNPNLYKAPHNQGKLAYLVSEGDSSTTGPKEAIIEEGEIAVQASQLDIRQAPLPDSLSRYKLKIPQVEAGNSIGANTKIWDMPTLELFSALPTYTQDALYKCAVIWNSMVPRNSRSFNKVSVTTAQKIYRDIFSKYLDDGSLMNLPYIIDEGESTGEASPFWKRPDQSFALTFMDTLAKAAFQSEEAHRAMRRGYPRIPTFPGNPDHRNVRNEWTSFYKCIFTKAKADTPQHGAMIEKALQNIKSIHTADKINFQNKINYRTLPDTTFPQFYPKDPTMGSGPGISPLELPPPDFLPVLPPTPRIFPLDRHLDHIFDGFEIATPYMVESPEDLGAGIEGQIVRIGESEQSYEFSSGSWNTRATPPEFPRPIDKVPALMDDLSRSLYTGLNTVGKWTVGSTSSFFIGSGIAGGILCIFYCHHHNKDKKDDNHVSQAQPGNPKTDGNDPVSIGPRPGGDKPSVITTVVTKTAVTTAAASSQPVSSIAESTPASTVTAPGSSAATVTLSATPAPTTTSHSAAASSSTTASSSVVASSSPKVSSSEVSSSAKGSSSKVSLSMAHSASKISSSTVHSSTVSSSTAKASSVIPTVSASKPVTVTVSGSVVTSIIKESASLSLPPLTLPHHTLNTTSTATHNMTSPAPTTLSTHTRSPASFPHATTVLPWPTPVELVDQPTVTGKHRVYHNARCWDIAPAKIPLSSPYNIGLNATAFVLAQISPETCATHCEENNYSFFGLTATTANNTSIQGSGTACQCGNTLGYGTVLRPVQECDVGCSGRPLVRCGGVDRLTLFKFESGWGVNATLANGTAMGNVTALVHGAL